MRERPNPEMAPYLPAAEVVRQKDRKKPIQLKRNATVKAEGKRCQTCPVNKEQECPLTCSCLNGFPKDQAAQPALHNPRPTSPKQTRKQPL